MGERLRIVWSKLNTGYWLIPSFMAVGAVGTSYLAVLLDARVSDGKLDSWWLGYTGGADGARAVLSAIASSMINVAGVVFSITVVILSLATQQFGVGRVYPGVIWKAEKLFRYGIEQSPRIAALKVGPTAASYQ